MAGHCLHDERRAFSDRSIRTFTDVFPCNAVEYLCITERVVNRNILYLVIGALVVATGFFGYQLYQERQKTTGIEVNIGKGGISIEKK